MFVLQRLVIVLLGILCLASAQETTEVESPPKHKLSYGDAKLTVLARGGSVKTETSAKYPEASKESISATSSEHFVVTFGIIDAETSKAFDVHQAFVKFTGKASQEPAIFPVHATSKGQYKWSLNVGDRQSLAKLAPGGDYLVSLLIGDARIDKPVEWTIGEVSLQTPPPLEKKTLPLYTTPLLHESDIALSPLKEIFHSFRAPESRPPVVVSLFATVVILTVSLSWLFSALYLTRFPFSFTFPKGFGILFALVFHVTLATILFLFAAYWFGLSLVPNFFVLLNHLVIPTIVLIISGKYLLTNLQNSELKAH